MFTKFYRFSAFILVFSFVTSCVPKKKFEALESSYSRTLSELAKKSELLDQCNTSLADLKAKYAATSQSVKGDGEKINLLLNQIKSLEKRNSEVKKTLDDCISLSKSGSVNINKLLDEINESNDYIKKLIASSDRKDSLNIALSNKLKRSLEDVNDKDVDIKVKKGVVFISLSDNMLYTSGSYNVKPEAKSVLEKVAKVINDYKDYDVLVEGHTDSQPIKKAGIKDNWDLSALRATAIVRYFQNNFNVDPARMTAGGRGEFVPKADNKTAQGRSSNRRTEVYILPKLDEFVKLMEQAPLKNDK